MTKSLFRTTALGSILSGLFVVLPVRAYAAGAEIDPAELIHKLADRVDQLERELRELKANGPAAADAVAEEAQPSYPRVHLNGFADFNFRSSNRPDAHAQFAVGEFDLFIKAAVSNKMSLLAETVLAADDSNNWGLDVERILFEYKASPYFSLSAGRFHTAIGYYNNAFHHGTWFQTATGRPHFLAFEDEGGLLPVHNVGLTAHGEIPGTRLGLHYFAELGNGRGFVSAASGANAVQNVVDGNDHKAINLALTAHPEKFPGLQLGTGLYFDKLSPEGLSGTKESIWHNFAVYKDAQWELLAEYYAVNHQATGGPTSRSTLWFAQVAHQFGALRPYFRYSHTGVPLSDNAFALLGATGQHNTSSFGVRWDFETYAAIKAQYDVNKGGTEPTLNDLTLQLALTF